MHIKIILIYCICDDLLSAFGLNDDKQCRMTSESHLNRRLHEIDIFIITPASTADITAFKLMEIDLPLDASIYGDQAYTPYSLEDDLQEFEKIRWIADRKTNATKQHSGCIQYLQSVLRKRIETTFSQLTSM